MSSTPDQKSLVTLIARTSTIAVIAMVMPLGIDISGDGVVSSGASVPMPRMKAKVFAGGRATARPLQLCATFTAAARMTRVSG